MAEKVKIAVLMWFDKKIKAYADINYEINNIYCKKYGYTLIKSDIRRCPERKPHWERVPLLLEHFDQFDYLIWIDADAHFYVDAPPIKNVIDTYSKKLFIFSADKDSAPIITCEINSGFFIVKTCKQSKNILTKWITDKSLLKSPLFSQTIFGENNWNDQAGLRLMYVKNTLGLKDNSIIIPYGILQHFNKYEKLKRRYYGLINDPFVYHCTNGPKNVLLKTRIKSSTSYLMKIIVDKYKPFMHNNIQLSKNVMIDILRTCENRKILVFGLGYDSDLWYNFANKNIFFIANNGEHIDLNKNIPNEKIVSYSYPEITTEDVSNLTEEGFASFQIPEKIMENAPYDLILINGRYGNHDNSRNKVLPIFWSGNYLSREGTIIYVDDVNNTADRVCINRCFSSNMKQYFEDRLGTIKIYV